MDKEKVLNLAKLARIEIGDEEAENLTHEFARILDYVGEVKGLTEGIQSTTENQPRRNVMREDADPHGPGFYTKEILDQAPSREGDYIKVKKIL